MTPSSEAELAEILAAATTPFAIAGGGSRGPVWGGAPLCTSALAGVSLYEPAALTLVAGAGTPLADIHSLLAGHNQRLSFDPPNLGPVLNRPGRSTLGGVLAANASGPRRVQSGAARDHAIGLRFVDGQGNIIKSGGRVMKNVTGLDLVKLLSGSHGTLGVLTQVAFKLAAIPEAETTLVATGLTDSAALGFLRAALTTPYDVSGAAHIQGGQTLIRLEGLQGSVTYRAAALKAALGGDWALAHGPQSAALWAAVRDLTPFVGLPGALWQVSLKPTEAAALVAKLAPFAPRAIYDWGGGRVWLLMDEDQGHLRRALEGAGHATLIRPLAGQTAAIFQPQTPEVAALAAALRQKFDPRGIFNRGLMA